MARLGITMTTDEEVIEQYIYDCAMAAHRVIVTRLKVLGEECVRRVRDRSKEESWIDQTGNLRSSIGYRVLQNGNVLANGGFFTTHAPDGDGGKGRRVGKTFLDEVSRILYQDYVLVVVAGMEYADKVEALESKDVLASTGSWAKQIWNEYLRRLPQDIDKECDKQKKKYGLA